jgi:MscS family membrane protein
MRTKKFVPVLFILATIILLAACTDSPPQSQLTPTATVTPDVLVVAPVDGDSEPVAVVPENTAAPPEGESQIVTTPTPEPTATPGIIEDAVSDIATATGLDRQIILGLNGEDWVNILISLGIALVGIFVVTQLVYILLLWIAKRAPGERASIFLRAVQFQIRSFIGIFILQYATNRLIFLSAEFKQTLNQIYFSLYVIAATAILCRLIGFALRWYQARISGEPEEPKLNEFLGLIDRLLRALLLIISTTVILNNFGVNVTVMLAVLGIGGLALSLAAQDTLSDIINGFLILIDQPFRIGDRILIHELETWGDIVGIGTRTTRIQTLDNRMIVVPNSKIGKSQVVNYSYPDPSSRMETDVDIAYGSDHNRARAVISKAVSQVEGVDTDKPVEVLLAKLGDSAMEFRVRWWIESYKDVRFVYDRVHSAILDALDEAGIDMPHTSYYIYVKEDHANR